MKLESNNFGTLFIITEENTQIAINPKDCIKLYHYLAERHFPDNPNIFVSKSIGDAFQ